MAIFGLFAGCSQPTEVASTATTTEFKGMYTLSPPDNVRAYAYGPTGLIRVSWDAVPNAAGYLLYRKTAVKNGPTTVTYMAKKSNDYSGATVGTASYNLYYDDAISYTNEFRTDATYTYRVVAFSNWSSNSALGNSGAGGWTADNSSNNDWVLLQNSSKDSNAVSFPATGKNALLKASQQLAKPAGLQLQRKTVYNTANYNQSEVLQVTWTAVPGIDYIVAYGLANDTGPNRMYLRTFVNNIAVDQTTGAYTIPLIYGKTVVEVVAKQKNPPTIGSNTPYYYLDSEPASITGTFANTTLNAPGSVSASRLSAQEIVVSWPVVPEADSYKVYRLISDNVSLNGTTAPGAGIYVYENWVDITGSVTVKKYLDTQAFVIDTKLTHSLANAQIYYMVVAVNGNAMSLPGYSSAVSGQAAITLTATNLGWDDLSGDYRGIHIRWQPRNNVEAYKLYRSPIEGSQQEGYNFVWTEITAGITLEGDGYYGVTDKPALRKNYQYKLETSFGEVFNSSTVSGIPYNQDLPFSLSASNYPASPYDLYTAPDARSSAYEIGLTVSVSGTGLSAIPEIKKKQLGKLWLPGETLRISRIKTNSSGQPYGGSYTVVRNINSSQFDAAEAQFLDPTLNNQPGYWRYMLEALNGTEVTSTASTSSAVSSSSPTNISSLAIVNPTSPGGTPGTTVISITGNTVSRLDKTQIIVRHSTGADMIAAQTNFNNGLFTVNTLTLARDGITNYYATAGIATPGGSGYYMEVTYKDGFYESGFGSNPGGTPFIDSWQ